MSEARSTTTVRIPTARLRPAVEAALAADARARWDEVEEAVRAEMSIPAQYAVDVDNAVRGRAVVDTALSSGGEILDRGYIMEQARRLLARL